MKRELNYASILYKLLDLAIKEPFVNYAGQGDIYEINSLNIDEYPIFWVAATEPVVEKKNYFDYVLTLYYIDREKVMNEEVGDTDGALIHNNGIKTLSNIIKKIMVEFGDDLLNEITDINYTLWGDTEIFNDKCSGVYCNITLSVPKLSNCPI